MKTNFVQTYLCHLLSVYPEGKQSYGKEMFTDLKGILKYFNLKYLEYGELANEKTNGRRRTFFLGRF